jgi:hypothetical protein
MGLSLADSSLEHAQKKLTERLAPQRGAAMDADILLRRAGRKNPVYLAKPASECQANGYIDRIR